MAILVLPLAAGSASGQALFKAWAGTNFGTPAAATCGFLEGNAPVSRYCGINGPFGFCGWNHGNSTSRAGHGFVVASGHNAHGSTCSISSDAITSVNDAVVVFHGPPGATTVNTRMRLQLRGAISGSGGGEWNAAVTFGVSAMFIVAYGVGVDMGFGVGPGGYYEVWNTNPLGLSLGTIDRVLLTPAVDVPLDVPIPVSLGVRIHAAGGGSGSFQLDNSISALSFVPGGSSDVPEQAFELPPGYTAESADLNIVNNVWTDPRPQVIDQPDPVSACPGGNAVFDIAVSGLGPFTFQWRKGGAPLASGPTGSGSVVSGSSTSTLTISGVSAADEGAYDCVVLNADDTTTSQTAGLLICNANCDCSSASPVLNVNDFACFLNKYAAGDPHANCDGSTLPPFLNVNDFACFLNQFAAGCPVQ